MQHRFAELPRQLQRQSGATFHTRSDAEHDRRVAFANIPLRALRIVGRGSFLQPVLLGNYAVFGPPVARAPAAVQNAVRYGKIERRPIGSRLPAGDNRDISQNSHAACCVWASTEGAKLEAPLYDATLPPTMPKKQILPAYSTISQVALVCYLIALLMGTHLPPNSPLLPKEMYGVDKVYHFTAYATLAGLLAMTWQLASGYLTSRHLRWAWIAISIMGALDEITQIPFSRDCEFGDWLADSLGAATGLLIFAGVRRLIAARKQEAQ